MRSRPGHGRPGMVPDHRVVGCVHTLKVVKGISAQPQHGWPHLKNKKWQRASCPLRAAGGRGWGGVASGFRGQDARGRFRCTWPLSMHLAAFDAPGRFRCTWPLSDAPGHFQMHLATFRCTWPLSDAPGHFRCTWPLSMHLATFDAPGHFQTHLAAFDAPGHFRCTWPLSMHLATFDAPGHFQMHLRPFLRSSRPRDGCPRRLLLERGPRGPAYRIG
jgi:hypothetical protein